jgi:hypothetical protein
MTVRIARLGEPNTSDAPFRFKRGDRVAWRRLDGSLDPDYVGVIVDGLCEYLAGGGAYKDRYVVERADGLRFAGGHLDLVKVNEEESS